MQAAAKRTTVDIDTRRTVLMMAKGRKPSDVARVPHEAFIRRELKSRMGYSGTEPAPDSVKMAAKEMAAPLEAADRAKLSAKAAIIKDVATEKNIVVIDAPMPANQEIMAETA